MTASTQDIPLCLYIHMPWCVRKCPYCDFNSHQAEAFPEQEYIQALLEDFKQEIELDKNLFSKERKIDSIFFGGGTPSLFSSKGIRQILDGLQKQRSFTNNCEITLEANPGTAEAEKFQGFRQAGVNRLSIGVQSFNDKQLNALGRVHSAKQAENAFQMARNAGFDNINLDLMHGLPEQSLQQALQDLQTAIELKPEHISWYQLTIEPNTVFYSKPPELPKSILLEEIDELGKQLLEDNAYNQYEISAYAKDNQQAQHNLHYWQFADYIGIGAGAHGKLTDPANKTILRRQKTRLPNDYLNPSKDFLAKQQQVQDVKLEFMMNALRLKNGVEKSLLTDRAFLLNSDIEQQINELKTQGLIKDSTQRIVTTDKGFDFLNQVLDCFL